MDRRGDYDEETSLLLGNHPNSEPNVIERRPVNKKFVAFLASGVLLLLAAIALVMSKSYRFDGIAEKTDMQTLKKLSQLRVDRQPMLLGESTSTLCGGTWRFLEEYRANRSPQNRLDSSNGLYSLAVSNGYLKVFDRSSAGFYFLFSNPIAGNYANCDGWYIRNDKLKLNGKPIYENAAKSRWAGWAPASGKWMITGDQWKNDIVKNQPTSFGGFHSGGSGGDSITGGWPAYTVYPPGYFFTTKPGGSDYADCDGLYILNEKIVLNGAPIYENDAKSRFLARTSSGWAITANGYKADILAKKSTWFGGFHSVDWTGNPDGAVWASYTVNNADEVGLGVETWSTPTNKYGNSIANKVIVEQNCNFVVYLNAPWNVAWKSPSFAPMNNCYLGLRNNGGLSFYSPQGETLWSSDGNLADAPAEIADNNCPTPVPTSKPTRLPTASPTLYPSTKPTVLPSSGPTLRPISRPTAYPIASPTVYPSPKPTVSPSFGPTFSPIARPTAYPIALPTLYPSAKPTPIPSSGPTASPISKPTFSPIAYPTANPTYAPNSYVGKAFLCSGDELSQSQSMFSADGTYRFTLQTDGNLVLYDKSDRAIWNTRTNSGRRLVMQSDCNLVLYDGGNRPLFYSSTHGRGSFCYFTVQNDQNLVVYDKTNKPVWNSGTSIASKFSVAVEGLKDNKCAPTAAPTTFPISNPTQYPIANPTRYPIADPTQYPIAHPTAYPIALPTAVPISHPTQFPIASPTEYPIAAPTSYPVAVPSENPIATPTFEPIADSTPFPNANPTLTPTSSPISEPTEYPIAQPTEYPIADPTEIPTPSPTPFPISTPTAYPIADPTVAPVSDPTFVPTEIPTDEPTAAPVSSPTFAPSEIPTAEPSDRPIASPTLSPISTPTADPIAVPTDAPISEPTGNPIASPTLKPVAEPTINPVSEPTSSPVSEPSAYPVAEPTAAPVADPTIDPVSEPTATPISNPTTAPVSKEPGLEDDKDTAGVFCPSVYQENGKAPTLDPNCALFAVDDLLWSKSKGTSLIFTLCASAKDGPVKIDQAKLISLGMVTSTGKSKLSLITYGVDSQVEFFSSGDFTGKSQIFSRKTRAKFQSLTQFHFKGSNIGNDGVNSAIFTTTSNLSAKTCD